MATHCITVLLLRGRAIIVNVLKDGVMSAGGLFPIADPFMYHAYVSAFVCLQRNTTSSFRVTFTGIIGVSVNSEWW